jgi:hypothetical protein
MRFQTTILETILNVSLSKTGVGKRQVDPKYISPALYRAAFIAVKFAMR